MKSVDNATCAARLQDLLPHALARLQRMVAINSFTANAEGVNRLGALTAECFSELGFTPSFLPSRHPAHGKHLVLERLSGTRKPVLMVTHLDTVFPEEEEIRNRFQWEEAPRENRIYGPGTVDIKGGTMLMWMLLHAVREFFPRLWEATDWVIAANASEETIGAEFGGLLSARYPRGARAVLVFEGGPRVEGAFQLVTARKGRAEYRLQARGVAAHAGSAHAEGVNAIVGLSGAVERVARFTDYARGLTLNVGSIRGGSVVNRVPHEACAELEIRAFDPGVLQHACGAVEGLETPLCREQSLSEITVECLGKSPAWPAHPETEALFEIWQSAAMQAGLKVQNTARGGLSDANYLWHLGPTLDGLGPSGANAHCSERSADGTRTPEYVEIDSFVPKALLNLLALGRMLETQPAE
jgi:glutamate carboxypeptidase